MPTETITNTNVAAPWGGQSPYLGYGFEQAQQNYIHNTPSYFPDQGFVPFNQNQLDAQAGIQGIAQNNTFGNAATAEGLKTLQGGYLNSNPYLDNMTNRVSRDVSNSVNSAFAGAGRFGSNAHADTLSQSVADAVAPIYNQNYQNERTNMMRASAIAPQTNALQYDGFNQINNIGNQQEAKAGQELQDNINRWNFGQEQPDIQLQNYMNAINGNYGSTSTSTQTAPLYGGNPVQGALGGGLAGYSLGNQFGYGGLGAIGGALLGGLFS